MRFLRLILLSSLLSQCVGIDYLDDPIIGESIEISTDPIAVIVGKTDQAKITFRDKYGIEQEVNPIWTMSSPDIASVDNKGIVSGLKPGQAFLIVSHSTARDTALVTVVGDATAVAKVEVVESVTILSVGQSVTLSATVKNINNQSISGKIVNWQSSNDLVLSINSAGVATANTNGTASVVAVVDGVSSNPVNFNVGNTSRMGEFVKSGGYEASGSCALSFENSKLVLKLENDFKTSFALGTFIYLSNTNTSASTVKSAGLELGQISVNGMHSFDITALNSSAKLGDYKYVIILCKPATVIFGYAELK